MDLVALDQPVLFPGGVQVVRSGAGACLDYFRAVQGERAHHVADDFGPGEQLCQCFDVVRHLGDLVLHRVQAGHLVERVLDPGLVTSGGGERDVHLTQVFADEPAGVAGSAVYDHFVGHEDSF